MQLTKNLRQHFYDVFCDLSIKNKLRALSIGTGIVVLLFSSTVLVLNEIYSAKRNLRTDLLTVADIAGRNAAAGLTFDNVSSV